MSEGLFDVPLKIGSTLREEDYNKVRIDYQERKDLEKVRLMFPIYKGQENAEILLKLLRKFSRAVERNDMWTKAGVKRVYDYFQRCLAGDALDTWFDITQTESKKDWEANLEELVDRSIGEEAYEIQ